MAFLLEIVIVDLPFQHKFSTSHQLEGTKTPASARAWLGQVKTNVSKIQYWPELMLMVEICGTTAFQ